MVVYLDFPFPLNKLETSVAAILAHILHFFFFLVLDAFNLYLDLIYIGHWFRNGHLFVQDTSMPPMITFHGFELSLYDQYNSGS